MERDLTRLTVVVALIFIGQHDRALLRALFRVAAQPPVQAVTDEVRDVAPGLWLWRVEHPDWAPGVGWPPLVTSTCVESGREVALLDPLAPAEASEVWARLDARGRRSSSSSSRITCATSISSHAGTRPRRSARTSSGPATFPRPSSRGSTPAASFPGGLVALYDGRGRNETPLWLPEQRALVFADALTAPDGELRVWSTPWHEERALPALRALLDLPFERVIVSHGEPVHDRAAYERALHLPPWSD